MQPERVRIPVGRWVVCALIGLSACQPSAFCQKQGSAASFSPPGAVPLVNVGGGDSMGPMQSQFESLDFAQKILAQQNSKVDPKELERQKGLVDSGTVSALDVAAPSRAVNEFNQATSLLRGQRSQEAIGHLQKAISIYPKFVSAHNYLGLAYLDLDDSARAHSEFEIAANLDQKFPARS